MGTTFEKWLEAEYRSQPKAFGAMAAKSLVVVWVRRRRWRGHRAIHGAEVVVEAETVKDGATTHPRWNLLPDEVKRKFNVLDDGVKLLVAQYCCNAGDAEEDEARATVLRRGVYAVDAGHWPRLKSRLETARKRWDEAADAITSEEGFEELVDKVKKRVGGDHFARVRPLIPDRQALRAKFSLEFGRLPIRLDPEQAGDADEKEGSASFAVEAVALVVKKPRLALAEAMRNLAGQLVTKVGDDYKPFYPIRTKDGSEVAGSRSISMRSVEAAAKAVAEFDGFIGFAEAKLVEAVGALRRDLPQGAAAAGAAENLRSDDAAAARVGKAALKAAEIAADESGMCEAVAGRLGQFIR